MGAIPVASRRYWREAHKFLGCSRAGGDPVDPLRALILAPGSRKGEALGLIEPIADGNALRKTPR